MVAAAAAGLGQRLVAGDDQGLLCLRRVREAGHAHGHRETQILPLVHDDLRRALAPQAFHARMGGGQAHARKAETDKNRVKMIAIEFLKDLKKEKLKVEQWADKSITAAAVFNAVSNSLYEKLPYPTYQSMDVDLKTNLVYEHLKHQYYGGGVSIYGMY